MTKFLCGILVAINYNLYVSVNQAGVKQFKELPKAVPCTRSSVEQNPKGGSALE